jgi:hypothetical protein
MTITFADGTRMEVAASAFDDFIRHDLKWVEFVHGRSSTSQSCCKQRSPIGQPANKVVHPCAAGGC